VQKLCFCKTFTCKNVFGKVRARLDGVDHTEKKALKNDLKMATPFRAKENYQ